MSSEEESVGSSPSSNHGRSTVEDFKNTSSWACFSCGKVGHFARDCPHKINGYRNPGAEPASDSNFPALQCPCGAGDCFVRTSGTDKNPGRKFYTCPAPSERRCNYFRWCDMVRKDQSNLSPRSKNPLCGCEAGISRMLTETTGPNAGRSYFVCPIEKGHGACNFFEWRDETIISSRASDCGSTSSPKYMLDRKSEISIPYSYSRKEINGSSEHPEFMGNGSDSGSSKCFLDTQLETSISRNISSKEINGTFDHPDKHGDEFQRQSFPKKNNEYHNNLKFYSTEQHNLIEGGADEDETSVPSSTVTELTPPDYCQECNQYKKETSSVEHYKKLGIEANGDCSSVLSSPAGDGQCLLRKSNGNHSRVEISSVEHCTELGVKADVNSDCHISTAGHKQCLLLKNNALHGPLEISSMEQYIMFGNGADDDVNSFPGSPSSVLMKPQIRFWSQITCADAPLLGQFCGWLGRLVFSPGKFLTESRPTPFYCCVFPSFDQILVPRVADVVDGEVSITSLQSPLTVKFGDQSLVTATQESQFSNATLWKASDVRSSHSIVQGTVMTCPILKAFKQAAAQVQNELISLLESMDPLDDEAMAREATAAFAALDCLHIDHKAFDNHVMNFISFASSLAKIEQFTWDYVCSKELVDWCNLEKSRLCDITRTHAEAMAAVTAFKRRLKVLRGEASHIKKMLIQFENQLSCCEAKTGNVESHLVQMSEDMLEPELILQALSKEASEALKNCQDLEAEKLAARAVLEKARSQLRDDVVV